MDLTNELEKLDIVLEDPSEDLEITDPVVHNPLVAVEPAKPMTVLESNVCELYSLGRSSKAISDELGVTPSTVRNILSKPHIRDFVGDLINAQYTTKLEGRLRIINSVIDAKLEKIEQEFDGDLSKVTKKDVIDLIVISDNIQKERQKKELGTDSNVYLQIMQQVTGGN